MKRYILQRPVVRKSVSFPGLTKNSNQTSQQLVYTLGNISSIVLSGLLSDDVEAGGAVGSMPPRDGFKWFPEMQMGFQNLREGINRAIYTEQNKSRLT